MILSLLGSFFISYSYAQDYSRYDYLSAPEIYTERMESRQPVDLKAVCSEMIYNYQEEKARIEKLKVELTQLAGLPLTDEVTAQIDRNKDEIHLALQHLLFLSRPEWNEEVLNVSLIWFLNNYNFKDKRVRNPQILSSKFNGLTDGGVDRYFHLGAFPIFKVDPDWPPFFIFHKKTAFLEACQSLSSLEYEVVVQKTCILYPDNCGQAYFILKGKNP
jgi:hypothetical protein